MINIEYFLQDVGYSQLIFKYFGKVAKTTTDLLGQKNEKLK